MKSNPYKWNSYSQNMFFGRIDLANDMVERLKKGESFGVMAGHKMGKTTLLRYVEKRINEDDLKEKHIKYVTVYFEYAENDKITSIDSIFKDIALKIYETTEKLISLESDFIADDFFKYLKSIKSCFIKKNIISKFIVIFDGIQPIIKTQWSDTFFRNWRVLLTQEKDISDNISAVFSGNFEIFDLAHDIDSPLKEVLSWKGLEPFSKNDTKKLIQEPFKDYIWDDDFINKLYELTGGHPFLIQYFMDFVCNHERNEGIKNLQKAKDRFLKEQQRVFKKWLDKLDNISKNIYAELTEYNSLERKKIIQKYRSDLLNSFNLLLYTGIINIDDEKGIINVAGSLFKEWFNKNAVYEKIDLNENIKENFKEYLFKYSGKTIGEKSLQYALLDIEIENFLCIKHAKIENIKDDTKWIFLTGENAAGKTAFLQAICIGICGWEDATELFINVNESKIGIRLCENKQEVVRNIVFGKVNRNRDFVDQPDYLSAYGPSRLDIMSMDYEQRGKRISNIESLIKQKGNLRNIELWMLKEGSNSKRYKSVIEILIKLMPNVDRIEYDNGNFFYIEKGYRSTINEVASGHKSVITTIGDILVRFFKYQPKVEDPKDFAGIVIIDEIDIHMHPRFQREFPKILSEVFPNIQFVCSTHSPIPMLGAPKESQFFVLERDNKKNTIIKNLNIDVSRLQPNAILTSPLFDLDSLISSQHKDYSKIRTEDDYKLIELRKERDKRIKEYEKKGIRIPKDWIKNDQSE